MVKSKMNISLGQLLIIALYLIFTVGALTMVKMGSEGNFSLSRGVFSLAIDIKMIIGLIMYIVSFLLYIGIIANFNLSYINPILTGISTVMIILSAVLILKEHITPYQYAGIALIILGAILANIRK
jgi:small multidrug resistance pump